MLDSHFRRIVQPFFDAMADGLVKIGITPEKATYIALAAGILGAISLLTGVKAAPVFLLWLSGFFDVMDGTIARKTGASSTYGAFLDIVFDRIVEGAYITAVAVMSPSSRLYLVILSMAVILSMTVFLTAGSVITVKTEKTFYYQAGLAERTEGFVFLTLMVLFPGAVSFIATLFAACVFITAYQRFSEVKRHLKINA